jgi:hypothetical protein
VQSLSNATHAQLQEYHHAEIPDANIEPDEHGIITVHRSADEVFAPRSLASFTGKPVVLGHPDEMVTGDNIRGLSVGHVMSARRGEGENSGVVTGDLRLRAEPGRAAVLHAATAPQTMLQTARLNRKKHLNCQTRKSPLREDEQRALGHLCGPGDRPLGRRRGGANGEQVVKSVFHGVLQMKSAPRQFLPRISCILRMHAVHRLTVASAAAEANRQRRDCRL